MTVREHGQNLGPPELDAFSSAACIHLAQQLYRAGVRRLELLSCVSPRVAPAMSPERIAAIAAGVGAPPGLELVTLVPNLRGYRAFVELGLGADGWGHTVGLFHSAVEAHNRANVRRSIDESVAEMRQIAAQAARDGNPVSAYLSAAFGYHDDGGYHPVGADRRRDQLRRLFELGARMVTLSDLQGLADEDHTRRVWDDVLAVDGGAHAAALGYHPHHVDPERAVDLVEVAYRAGVRCFDGSLRATGGCVTGAPGNAPSGRVLARLARLGADHGVDVAAVRALDLP